MAQSMPSELRMQDLYSSELVTIRVGPAQRNFKLPRGLICARSSYFEKAFQQGFKEGEEALITLSDVKEWVFECFVSWLYTNIIIWEPVKSREDAQGPSGVKDSDSHENSRGDATTWNWEHIITMYIFADQYDTAQLRNHILTVCCVKALTTTRGLKPSYTDLARVFSNLPESSGMYRLMEDAFLYHTWARTLTEFKVVEKLPHSAMARLLLKSMQLTSAAKCDICSSKGKQCQANSHRDIKRIDSPLVYNPCGYHEHGTDEERKLCKAVYKDLAAKYGMAYIPDP